MPIDASEIPGAPLPGTPVPAAVVAIADDRPLRPLWHNELGGLTYAIDDPHDPVVVKWSPPDGPSLADEAARLRWLAPRHAAPAVRQVADDGGGSVLVTGALPGTSAVDARWLAEPATAVAAIGEGLRRLHALPVDDCPFSWTPADRILAARAAGGRVPTDLEIAPPIDRLVVGHGDACAPNTLVGDDGAFLATIDVGRLGLADRWSDLAVASMSLSWNFGGGFESVLFEAYGIEPDTERIGYYRALWDVAD